MATAILTERETLRTLPSDAARQVQWGFADRFDLQMLVQSARSVARGPVARLVAQGGRNSHEWTAGKAELLEAFDSSGITAVFMDPEEGGLFAGRRILHWRWLPSNWRGWMVELRLRVWRDVSRWPQSMSAELLNNSSIT
jgi:alkylation response protein AidB-like acyl-CoA dehydrogenase